MRPVEEIATEAETVDGAAPVDEATWRALRLHPEQVRSFRNGDGFALLVGDELTLVVRPEARRQGVGRALLEQALAEAGRSPLLAWSHADHPAAAALAAAYGFEAVRALWVMRRPTSTALPDLVAPTTVALRSYRPEDASEIVRVNAAAFAAHPEQGRMDTEDLAARMAEEWFDPAGLIVADDGAGGLLGFHWTKRHSPQVAEVYVVAIDSTAQGQGLGKVLTLAGLHHLADADEVLLYVEADNAPAIAVYAGLGFTHAASDTHVQYLR
jgi:mycothiol synthase